MGKIETRCEKLLEAINLVEKASDSADQKSATNKRRLALLLHYAGSEGPPFKA